MLNEKTPGRIVRMSDGFHWDSAPDKPYKEEGTHFAGVRRADLAGMLGEKTAFHLRYFEIEGGGFTSREHHEHEHVIVVIRGEGDILLGDKWKPLKFGDVAYVAPGVTHRLRNDFTEPFGFLCVVDADRDDPVVETDPSIAGPCGEN